jgi:hypothetical protein
VTLFHVAKLVLAIGACLTVASLPVSTILELRRTNSLEGSISLALGYGLLIAIFAMMISVALTLLGWAL